MPIPEDAEIGTFGSDAMITLRSDWTPPGGTKAYVAGTLLALPMSDVMENNWASALPLFEPTASKSLQSMTTTKVRCWGVVIHVIFEFFKIYT